MERLEGYLKKIPEFKGANRLIRTPLAIVFILQGLQKMTFNKMTSVLPVNSVQFSPFYH